jgi:hypothetical protein
VFFRCGKGVFVLLCAFLLVGATSLRAFAVYYDVFLDARDDAGLSPGTTAFAKFVDSNSGAFLGNLKPRLTDAPTAAQQVIDVAPNDQSWWLKAAGNPWSSDTIVGETLHLGPGAYEIWAMGGSFLYDSFNWSDQCNIGSQWDAYMRGPFGEGGTIANVEFGTFTPTDVPGNTNLHYDITLTQATDLWFWIKDGNSIDNSGGLNLRVTSVPEPSPLLLLLTGLPLVLPGLRRAIFGK